MHSLVRPLLTVACAATLSVLAVTPLGAQAAAAASQAAPKRTGPISQVLVRDTTGQAVPYAMVVIKNGQPRVADAEGIAHLPTPVDADSADLVVRRIGYRPFGDWVGTIEDGRFVVELQPLPRALTPRTVSERRDTPLARRGFYDRMERVRRGATLGRFFTPEELDSRQVTQVSSILAGENYVRLERFDRRPILTGRQPGCAITVIVDGMRMTGMVEDLYTREGQDEVRRLGGGYTGTQRFLATRQTVDDIISALSVAGMELYPTAAAAPPELQRAAGNGACGILAIWSGSRQ